MNSRDNSYGYTEEIVVNDIHLTPARPTNTNKPRIDLALSFGLVQADLYRSSMNRHVDQTYVSTGLCEIIS